MNRKGVNDVKESSGFQLRLYWSNADCDLKVAATN
jgi:hypothetical protein